MRITPITLPVTVIGVRLPPVPVVDFGRESFMPGGAANVARNLSALGARTDEVLRAADLIACEDTRQTRKLLDHYGIRKPTVSYHEHNEATRSAELIHKLENGESVALVSDAGTPLVSDPGFRLVRAAREAGIVVHAVPGPCAAIAARPLARQRIEKPIILAEARSARLRHERPAGPQRGQRHAGQTPAPQHRLGGDRHQEVGPHQDEDRDHGRAARLLGAFSTWLQERKGAVFVVATANDVSRLPPELLRRGRFDELFFVDLPDAAARQDGLYEVQVLVFRNFDPDPPSLSIIPGGQDLDSGDCRYCRCA